jgi:hypothetical protein
MKFALIVSATLLVASCSSTPETESKPAESQAVTAPDKISSIQDRLREADDSLAPDPGYKIDLPRFDAFRTEAGTVRFEGKTLAEVTSALGDPFTSRESGNKSVLLYRVYPDDSTALYLFLKDDVVEQFRLDEFNGWEGSSALNWFNL